MKKFTLIMIGCLMGIISMEAQQTAVKLGLGGLLVTAPNLRFEQAVGDRMSFQITGSYKFPTKISNATIDDAFSIGEAKISGFAIIPEFRFYFGKEKAGTIEGFYLAPYLKYHKYGTKTTTSFNYVNPQNETIPLNPELSLDLATIGGGLQIGYHWIFGEHFSLDWHFLGIGGDAHRIKLKYDFTKDDLDLKDVARYIRDEYNAENPENRVEFSDEEIDDLPINGNQIKASVPFAFIGFRAGISIGYAF